MYIALHTADPGEAGNQSTSEATYTSYARVGVNRNSGGWTASANPCVNAAQITMPQCTGGSNTITHVSIGTDPWSVTLEGTYTAGEMLKLLTAVAAGKSDIVKLGNGLATITFRDINDTENRVIASMTNSERTAVILNP